MTGTLGGSGVLPGTDADPEGSTAVGMPIVADHSPRVKKNDVGSSQITTGVQTDPEGSWVYKLGGYESGSVSRSLDQSLNQPMTSLPL